MSVEDLMRQFPKGLPIDPWGNRMGTTVTTTGDILVYSGGPRGQPFREPLGDTSHALTLQYDPTNGVISAGDLFMRIPRR